MCKYLLSACPDHKFHRYIYLQAGKMILISGESQRAYQLTQTPSEGDDGTNVTVKGWTAVDGLEGQEWDIYLELDGVLYNTGYMYSQA